MPHYIVQIKKTVLQSIINKYKYILAKYTSLPAKIKDFEEYKT